jgi:hypothetical protein
MTDWLRNPPPGISLVQDQPDQADKFHRTVGADLLSESDAITLALYQAHSEIHVVYFLRFNNGSKYQYRRDPPRYVRSCRFQDVKDTIEELKMPRDALHTYCSIVIGGGHFAGATGRAHKRYQEFTVELFGKRTYGSGRPKDGKWPYLSRRSGSLNRWHESADEVIEIWRTRVFLCSLKKLGSSFEKSSGQHFPYLQETWDPKWPKTNISLNGLEKLNSRYSFVDFYSTADRIRAQDKAKIGGIRCGPYRTPKDFYKAVKKVYSQLFAQTGSYPIQKEVALKMSLFLSTFKEYWRKTGIRWRDLRFDQAVRRNQE